MIHAMKFHRDGRADLIRYHARARATRNMQIKSLVDALPFFPAPPFFLNFRLYWKKKKKNSLSFVSIKTKRFFIKAQIYLFFNTIMFSLQGNGAHKEIAFAFGCSFQYRIAKIIDFSLESKNSFDLSQASVRFFRKK